MNRSSNTLKDQAKLIFIFLKKKISLGANKAVEKKREMSCYFSFLLFFPYGTTRHFLFFPFPFN